MAKKYTKSEIEGMIKSLEAKEKKARSKWGKAVLQDAQWLLENVIEGYDEPYELSENLVLNGAENWNKFSWGGSALVGNGEIAEHYGTPSELKKVGFNKENMYVEKQPNANEEWLDVQARALRQAWWAIRDEMKGTTEFSMSLCEFSGEGKGKGIKKSNFEIEEDEISELKQEHGQEYLQEKYPDDMIYPMDEIDELSSSAWNALRGAFFGGRYGYDQDSFNPNDDYFYFNGSGNLVSVPYLDEYLDNEIDDDNFIEWCKEQGYYEENDDDEGEDKDNMSIYELSAQHDSRKSFYGKAQADVDDKTGVQTLYSYGTKVAQYNPKTKKFTAYPEAKYSATTKRQVREFMKQNGVPASEFSIVDDTKDVIKATGKLAGNIVKNTTDKGGLLMF